MRAWFGCRLAAAAILGLAVTGCETDSATSPVTITPASADVAVGQSVTFTASGGYDYAWALSDNAIGALSTRNGPQVTYTSVAGSSTGAPQVLTVTSRIEESANLSVTTNGVTRSYGVTAEAYIRHR